MLFCTTTEKKQLIEKISNFFKASFFCLCTFLILFRVAKNKSGLSYTIGKEIFVVIFGWGVIYNHKRLLFYSTWESVFIPECHPNPWTQWGRGWILNLLYCSCSHSASAGLAEAQQGLHRLYHLYFCYFCLVFISLSHHCYCRVEYNSIYALNTYQCVQVSHPADVSGLNEWILSPSYSFESLQTSHSAWR